jgi:hypothetical protein
MALDSVGARIEGDVFQGLFFWREAAGLLLPESPVMRVDLEHDEADGVDDVAVFYDAPGIEAGGFRSTADFYQMKYHVDRRDEYSADAIIDPAFIGKTQSFLQRFHGAYNKVRGGHSQFRLHLASNWRWSADALGKHLREYDGALPDEFFTAGPRSAVGKVREAWRNHLRLDRDTFAAFARCLRFQTDLFGRRFFRDFVNDRLARAGLKPVPDDRAASPYESLTQRFLMDRKASFDRTTFRELCAKEGLLADSVDNRRSRTIGVRSFLRFAETLEEEAAIVISVVDWFSGRHPKDEKSWATATSSLQQELAVPDRHRDLRANEHEVMLECHGSFALAAGYELSNNSGALVYPVQKPGREPWKPSGTYTGQLWTRDESQPDPAGKDVVVTLSVTHDVRADVDSYVSNTKLGVGRRVDLRPAAGFGPKSIAGADHAVALAAAFVDELRKARLDRSSIVHLFAAAPNALMFFIGQQREALARIQIYEFDFSFERDGSYAASIAIPHMATMKE